MVTGVEKSHSTTFMSGSTFSEGNNHFKKTFKIPQGDNFFK